MSTPTRNPRRLHLGVVTLSTAAVLLAGCSGTATTDSPTPQAPAPAPAPGALSGAAATASPAALEWTGTVCTALDPLLGTITSPPRPDLTDAAATQQAYSSYLGTAVTQADQARAQIAAAGSPPVSGQVGQDLQNQLTELTTKLSQAKAQVDGANPADPSSITQAAGAAGNVVGSVGDSAQALSAVRNDPQLRPAFEQASSCAPLRTIGSPS